VAPIIYPICGGTGKADDGSYTAGAMIPVTSGRLML